MNLSGENANFTNGCVNQLNETVKNVSIDLRKQILGFQMENEDSQYNPNGNHHELSNEETNTNRSQQFREDSESERKDEKL